MARKYTLQEGGENAESGIDYEVELNAEQLAAVTTKASKALVIAGAGSGKTRTLTYRVAWLLDHGVEAHRILLLTFTNKAAREMTDRVRALVPMDISALWSGTFHSICNRILRRHAELLGFTSSFTILDGDDQRQLVGNVVTGLEIDTKARRFPKAAVLMGIISYARNTGIELKSVVAQKYPYFSEWEGEIQAVGEAYAKRKRETNSMDFDDLLILTLELFRTHPGVAAEYQRRFQHVLVDEFQDTNAMQSELVETLAAGGAKVMAVGDDAQSIYSWRGADMSNILSFPKRHAGCEVYKIETNYRSVPEILELSNAAIRHNRQRFEKDLQPAREVLGMRPALVPLADPATQAQFVAQRILELRDEGVELAEMAVLYRAHFQSMDVQMELTRRGIPFTITSGLRFFEQAHVKDVAAFLRFVTNRRDETSFKRMVSLLSGIGPGRADRLWREWLAGGWGSWPEPPDWEEVLGEMKGVPPVAEPQWRQLAHVLAEMSPEGKLAPPGAMIFSVLEGLYDDYLRSAFENYDNRRGDIEQLMEYGGRFDDALAFLSELSLLGEADGGPGGRRESGDEEKMTLSSVHQAKGLEWKVVFLIWLTDGGFPNGRVLASEDEEALEEERRLFYVAMTRAKDELYLSYPMMNSGSYSGDMMQRPSRFLQDFPHDLVEEWVVGGRGETGREAEEPF